MATKTRSVDEIDRIMAENRAAFADAKSAIKADKNLSEEGKRRKTQEARSAANAKHEELRAERSAAIDDEHERLYRKAFQSRPATAESRALFERASSAAGPKDLAVLMGQASRTNDSELRRAVVQSAFDRGFFDLIPDDDSVVQDLLGFVLRHQMVETGNRAADIGRRLSEDIRRTAPS